MSSRRRIVVTGLGAVSPLGLDVATLWHRLVAGDVATTSLKGRTNGRGLYANQFDALPSTVAAVVPAEFNATSFAKQPNVPTFAAYALAAANEALTDARWTPTSDRARRRTGVAIGSGIGNLDDVAAAAVALATKGPRHISPFFVPRILVSMAAGHVSIAHGLYGPNHAVATACTTGLHAIGDAMRFVRDGDADVMLAGGTEACVNPLAMAGFARLRALATDFNDRPHLASRPFDKGRSGFVIGEGAAVVVLEEYNHAKDRGAKVYAEIVGYGLSGDGHHITAPSDDGRGAYYAMANAFESAQMQPSDVDYVNAHATSTPLGDSIELAAIGRIFGEHPVAVSSTKGATGHLLGAAGALEAIIAILAVHHDVLPPTANLTDPEPTTGGVRLVGQQSEKKRVRAALTNSFGFGGTNGSLIFTKP